MSRPGTLRIIGGTAGGLRLTCPKTVKIRPTADRVRESVFNILAGAVSDARALDLFAGSGAFGIEALSRGARRCLFVERRAPCVAAIRENLRKTGLTDRAEVILADAFGFPGDACIAEPFDIIFLDPPYRFTMQCTPDSRISSLIGRVAAPDILAPGGRIILEHDSKARAPDAFPQTTLTDRRKYGTTSVSFYAVADTSRKDEL